jgi:hypothetical protein
MTDYPFLTLCALTWMPALLTGMLRRDLRMHMARVALLALPFAFTEFLFYPEYWNPPFLFDFAQIYGFGIEDFLFVAALGATAIGVYPFLLHKRFVPHPPSGDRPAYRIALLLIGFSLLAALICWHVGMPAIYAAPLIMISVSLMILFMWRRDLWRDACKNGLVTLSTYGVICLTCEACMPGVFAKYWHTGELLNTFAGPIPLEELIYGFTVGTSVTVVYSFSFGLTYAHNTRGATTK